MKVCSLCKEEKPIEMFYVTKTGLHSWCKPCAKNYSSEWGKANRERKRENYKRWIKNNRERTKWYDIKKKYAMSREEYEEIIDQQGGVCAICKDSDRSLQVDHCHETKKVRGLLCKDCNLGLGRFKDVPELLRKAADYLERT